MVSSEDAGEDGAEEEEEEDSPEDVLRRLQQLSLEDGRCCQPETPQTVRTRDGLSDTTPWHLPSLPAARVAESW